jgi:hypothetical protein
MVRVGCFVLVFSSIYKAVAALWKCGNRAFGDFQGRWETMENRSLVFLVFHRPAFP